MSKLFFKGLFIMTMLATNPAGAFINSKDEAAIKTIVESVGTFADTRNFDALEKLYAPEVELDYTSLSGGEVELKSPKAIMTQWANVLPGFDRTYHQVNNIRITQQDKSVIATADVIAEHWINDMYWQVKGNYRYQFVKEDNQWQITAHQFNFLSEKGTREVFVPAIERVKAYPTTYVVRQKTRQAIIDFLVALETKDMDGFANVWAEDAVQEMPYSPKGFPKKVVGKANLLKHYSGWPKNSGKADFRSQLVFYPMQDPELMFVEFKGDVDIVPTGRKYLQTYGGLFHVENGKIKLFREYFDPAPFVYAFGLEGGVFNN